MDEQRQSQQDETSNFQGVMTPEMQPKSRPAYGKILLGILGVLVIAAYIGYVALVKPYVVVGKSMAQLSTYDSAQVTYTSPDEKLKVKFEGSGEEKPARFDITINKLSENKDDALEIAGIFTKKDIYAQANYSEPALIEKSLVTIYPSITKTQTYKLASPLWQGSKWLHLAIPESEEGKSETTQTQADLSDPEMRRMVWDWYWAVKPGKIEQNYTYQGESYTRVSFGFNKNRLIKAINGLKDLDVDLKVSQINSIVEVIESSNDWERDLVAFLIDKKGDLRVVTLQLPEIKQEVLDKSISSGLAEQEGGAMLGGLVTSAKEMIWGSKGDMVELGVIKFGQFNEVEEIKVPDNLIEATDLMTVAQTELGPIFVQMLGGMMQGGKTPSTMMPSPKQTVATSKPTVACTQFKIREGEFASDKCYMKSDYDDLMYYIQRYNSAISTYNAEAAQANITCNGSSEMFKQSCEESKAAMQKAEADKQTYAGTIRTIIARGR